MADPWLPDGVTQADLDSFHEGEPDPVDSPVPVSLEPDYCREGADDDDDEMPF